MRKELFWLIAVLVIGFTSCDPAKQYQAEIEEIDSCITHIEDLEAKLDGIEFDSLIMMVDHVLKNEELIKQYYKPDTLDASFGMLMNECKGVRKNLKGIEGAEMKYGDELNAIKHQFMDLKTDIENGVLKEDKIKEYLEKEKKDLSIVSAKFLEFHDQTVLQSQIYYHDVPQVDAYIEKLIQAQSDSLTE